MSEEEVGIKKVFVIMGADRPDHRALFRALEKAFPADADTGLIFQVQPERREPPLVIDLKTFNRDEKVEATKRFSSRDFGFKRGHKERMSVQVRGRNFFRNKSGKP
ncbi:MAG: hypothetical protein KBC81_01440 [Candidatus Pacebacteria bacterium]|nr:hypothetical protein [Candidatus Paceibacterota bacterium]